MISPPDSSPLAGAPVIPRLAATLILLRDGAAGLEALMLQRHAGSSFAAGAQVFPGGALDPIDRSAALQARCRPGDAATPEDLAARAGAIRETFEESGILLARRAGDDAPIAGAHQERLRIRYQHDIATAPARWLDMILAEDLELACDLLVPFAHWITPEGRPKRFDTRFFLAPMPPDQTVAHDDHEAVAALWLRPATAIAEADAGALHIVFATRMNLLKLGASDGVAAALAAARRATIVTVTPRFETRSDGPVMCIPLAAGYGVEIVAMDKIPRA